MPSKRTAKKIDSPDEDLEDQDKVTKTAHDEVDEDGVVIRNKTTVDVDPHLTGVTLGEPVENWRGEYEEASAPTMEELQVAAAAAQPFPRGGHDYDAKHEEEVTHLGILYPTYE